jgi:hypothetical protein
VFLTREKGSSEPTLRGDSDDPQARVKSRAAAAAAQVAQQARVMRGDEALTLVLASERQGGDRVQEHGITSLDRATDGPSHWAWRTVGSAHVERVTTTSGHRIGVRIGHRHGHLLTKSSE